MGGNGRAISAGLTDMNITIPLMHGYLGNLRFKSKFALLFGLMLLPNAVAASLLTGTGPVLAPPLALLLFVANLAWILALLALYSSLQTAVETLAAAHRLLADGDFNARLQVSGRDELSALSIGFNDMARKLGRRMDAVHASIREVNYAADQLNQGADFVAEKLERQRQGTTMIAAAIEQMSASIMGVAGQCREAETISSTTRQLSRQGLEAIERFIAEMNRLYQEIKDLDLMMQRLEKHSQQVFSISAVIKSISEQTNLLALNAAIEAARAGESGRGFAVVADEVRSLSQRVRRSAEEISGTTEIVRQQIDNAVQSIANTQSQTEQGIHKAVEVEQSLANISRYADHALENVTMIAASAEQQSQVSLEIGRNIETIAQSVEQNSNAAQESAAIARHLAKLAQIAV